MPRGASPSTLLLRLHRSTCYTFFFPRRISFARLLPGIFFSFGRGTGAGAVGAPVAKRRPTTCGMPWLKPFRILFTSAQSGGIVGIRVGFQGLREQLRPLKAQLKEGMRAGAEELQKRIKEGTLGGSAGGLQKMTFATLCAWGPAFLCRSSVSPANPHALCTAPVVLMQILGKRRAIISTTSPPAHEKTPLGDR